MSSGSEASVPPLLSPHQQVIRELIECGQDFHRRGWSLGTSSNYSAVIGRDPLRLVLTGSGFDKGRLQPENFVIVDEQGVSIDASLPKPSAETLLHTVLAREAGAGAVLHTHSIAGTVLSEGFVDAGLLKLEGYEMLKGLAGITTHESSVAIEIFPNTQDIATLAEEVAERLKDEARPLRHGFLMAGHGLYTWGKNVAEARRHIEVLEYLFEVVTRKKLLFGRF